MYMFLNFSTQWNSIRRRNQRWKVALEQGAWISLHFHSSLLSKKGAWHKQIQEKKGSDFPSPRTTNSVWLILGLQYSIDNPRLSRVQLCKNYVKQVCLLWWLNKFLVPMIPLRTNFDTQLTVISHRRRKWFSSSAGLLFRSEFSDRQHDMGFGNKSIMFLHFPRKFRAGQLALLWISFDFRNVIFQPVVFSFVGAKYKWKIMRDHCKLSFPQPLASPASAYYSDSLVFSWL